MIVDKFYDINGQPYKVQAAGTVYNEQKNSLALGTGTTANGQDQFVFGRANIADTTSVEIVGGGLEKDEYPFDLTKLQELNKVYTFNVRLSGSSTAVYKGTVLATTLQNYINALKNRPIYTGGAGGFETKTFTSVVIDPQELEEYSIEPDVFILFQPNNSRDGWIFGCIEDDTLYKWGDIHTDGNTTLTLSSIYSHSTVQSIQRIGNIRTLDWYGNEKLAGGLEIGGNFKIGATSLSEAQLISLLALLNPSE